MPCPPCNRGCRRITTPHISAYVRACRRDTVPRVLACNRGGRRNTNPYILAEGQGFEGCEPDGQLMGLRVVDSTRGGDTVRRVPTVNLCENTAQTWVRSRSACEMEFRSRSIYVAWQGKGQRRTFHLIEVFQYSKNDHDDWDTHVDCEVE